MISLEIQNALIVVKLLLIDAASVRTSGIARGNVNFKDGKITKLHVKLQLKQEKNLKNLRKRIQLLKKKKRKFQ